MSLFEELKRRNVIRVCIAYIVAAWLILQFSDILLDNMEAPDWVFQVILLLLAIGLVLTVFFAWAFELTPDGVVRAEEVDLEASITPSTGRKLNALTIVLLVVAVLFLLWDKFDGSDAPTSIAEDTTEATIEQEKSIAVLPLRTRSNVEEDTYFADGIHDDLLTQLAKLSSLDKVISRTSTERYRDTTMSMQAIGSELGVATILEGGVQRAGTRVRINMQLIDAVTDEHMWAQTYERELTVENLFAIQSEITREVVNALHVVMSDEEQESIAAAPTNSLDAHREYALGRREMAKRNGEAIFRAEKYFEAATQIDPNYADAWVGLADSLLLQDEHANIPFEQNEARIQAALDKALALDPRSGKAYTAMANVAQLREQLELSEEYFKKAIELSPNYATAYHWYSLLLNATDRQEDGLVNIRKAVELDPLAPILAGNLAASLWYFGRDDEAIKVLNQSLKTNPEFATNYATMGGFLTNQGRHGEATRWFSKAAALNPDNAAFVRAECFFLAAVGLYDVAEMCLDALDERHPGSAEWLHLYLYSSLERFEDADKYIATLVEDGLDEDLQESFVGYYYRSGQEDKARPIAKEVFAELFENKGFVIDTDNVDDAVVVAHILLQDGEVERANDLLDQSLAVMETMHRTRNSGYNDDDLFIHVMRDDIESAKQSLTEMVEHRVIYGLSKFRNSFYDPLWADADCAALLDELTRIAAEERQWYLDHKDEPLL